jgi:ABC-2 type transport system permease protein
MTKSWNAILTIAYKEFVHVWRDRRVLALIVILPPFFTFVFGHAFEVQSIRDVTSMFYNDDGSPLSQRLAELLHGKDVLGTILEASDNPQKDRKDIDNLLKSIRETFTWKAWQGEPEGAVNLVRAGVQAAIVIPKGWGKAIQDGAPISLRLVLDGTDTNTAPAVEQQVRSILEMFQINERMEVIKNLPGEIVDMGEKLSPQTQNSFTSSLKPWDVRSEILYNPDLLFIDFVVPGIIGLILQLLTVTLIASTITREREVGTLSQLLVTPLRQAEIVIGKVIPYLLISTFLIAETIAVGYFHFGVKFRDPVLLTLVCLLFLLFSLGLGLLISAFSKTQTQAIQFSFFFLLPVLMLSGAFSSLELLPGIVRAFSELFPLTHFCRAFRSVNLYGADFGMISFDLVCLGIGAIVTCVGAAILLRNADDS